MRQAAPVATCRVQGVASTERERVQLYVRNRSQDITKSIEDNVWLKFTKIANNC